MNETISETRPRARTNHCCVYCGELVKKGDRYIRRVSKYEGEFQSSPWHIECYWDSDNMRIGDFSCGEFYRKDVLARWFQNFPFPNPGTKFTEVL